MYDQLRKNVGRDDDDEEDEEEEEKTAPAAVAEEVKAAPAMQEQPAPVEPEADPIAQVMDGLNENKDPLQQMAELMGQVQQEPEFRSDLEELD